MRTAWGLRVFEVVSETREGSAQFCLSCELAEAKGTCSHTFGALDTVQAGPSMDLLCCELSVFVSLGLGSRES